MSAGSPSKWTGMIARVRLVILRSMSAGSMLYVAASDVHEDRLHAVMQHDVGGGHKRHRRHASSPSPPVALFKRGQRQVQGGTVPGAEHRRAAALSLGESGLKTPRERPVGNAAGRDDLREILSFARPNYEITHRHLAVHGGHFIYPFPVKGRHQNYNNRVC